MRSTRRILITAALLLLFSPSAARASFRAKAEEVTNYIQSRFWDSAQGLYRPAVPPDPKALPYDFMWANGVQFSALVGAARHDPTRYRPWMDAFFRGMDRHWDAAAP